MEDAESPHSKIKREGAGEGRTQSLKLPLQAHWRERTQALCKERTVGLPSVCWRKWRWKAGSPWQFFQRGDGKQFPTCLRTELLGNGELQGIGLPSGREACFLEKHNTGPSQPEKAASVGPVAQKA